MAQSPVRASDVDRERVAEILRSAAGQGLLTLAEVDERLAQVYGATYVADLAPLTADLPEGGRRLAPVDPQVRSRARLGAAHPRRLRREDDPAHLRPPGRLTRRTVPSLPGGGPAGASSGQAASGVERLAGRGEQVGGLQQPSARGVAVALGPV